MGRGGFNRTFPTIDMRATGVRLKEIMDDRGFSVKDIQNYLGLAAAQSVYHWLDGRSLPTVDNLYALSELFCLTIDDMLCGNRIFQQDFSMQRRLFAYRDRFVLLKAG